MADNILIQNKQSWDAMADSWFGTTALPTYGCLIPTEDELNLFPDLHSQKVDIGWTVDLRTTFNNIASYLKKDGVFIFSWDHLFMHCVDVQEDKIIFEGCYLDEDIFSYIQRGNPVTIKNRKLSAYINSLDVSFGNVFENSIIDILNSKKREDWIDKVRIETSHSACASCDKNKICPECIGLGYLENGNFIDKIKPLCELVKVKCELDVRKSI